MYKVLLLFTDSHCWNLLYKYKVLLLFTDSHCWNLLYVQSTVALYWQSLLELVICTKYCCSLLTVIVGTCYMYKVLLLFIDSHCWNLLYVQSTVALYWQSLLELVICTKYCCSLLTVIVGTCYINTKYCCSLLTVIVGTCYMYKVLLLFTDSHCWNLLYVQSTVALYWQSLLELVI